MAAFCGQCGTALRREAMFCPMCGTATDDGEDTADRQMPAWFANGEPPPLEHPPPATATVVRAPLAAAGATPVNARPGGSANNLYLWVSGAVVATAAVVITIALLFWPTNTNAATTTSTSSTTTTTSSTPVSTTAPPVSTTGPVTTRSVRTTTSTSWQSWIDIDTRPETIQNYPCRQMADHGVPYDFVMQYFHKWNWVYISQGGGGMDQDGNGKPCEGQFPQAASYY